MKIYWFATQASRRVLALVKHLGIEAEFDEVALMSGGLQTPEYTALNPNRKTPTLVDGDQVLWEASAIMAYLCIKTGSDLWPAHNPTEQVEILRWLSWNDCHWGPAVSPFYFEHVVKTQFGIGAPDHALLEASVDTLKKFAKVLDVHLAGRDYVACNRLTVADFQLGSMATDWRASQMPLQDFPQITRWLDGLLRIPAWADPWPLPVSANT